MLRRFFLSRLVMVFSTGWGDNEAPREAL